MSQKRKDLFLRNISGYLDEKLEPLGFSRYAKYRWLRKWNWKTDIVDLYDRLLNVMINFTVMLPPYKDYTANIGCINLFSYMDHSGSTGATYKYPSWPWSYKDFEEKVRQAVDKGLPWFSNFDTPAACWAYMQKHEWRLDTPHARNCEEYLKLLPEAAQQGQILPECLLDPQGEYYDDYTRAMFDVNFRQPLPPVKEEEDD